MKNVGKLVLLVQKMQKGITPQWLQPGLIRDTAGDPPGLALGYSKIVEKLRIIFLRGKCSYQNEHAKCWRRWKGTNNFPEREIFVSKQVSEMLEALERYE